MRRRLADDLGLALITLYMVGVPLALLIKGTS